MRHPVVVYALLLILASPTKASAEAPPVTPLGKAGYYLTVQGGPGGLVGSFTGAFLGVRIGKLFLDQVGFWISYEHVWYMDLSDYLGDWAMGGHLIGAGAIYIFRAPFVRPWLEFGMGYWRTWCQDSGSMEEYCKRDRDDFVFRPGAGLAVTLHQHFWFTISLSYYLAAINRDDQPRGDGFQVGVGVLGSL